MDRLLYTFFEFGYVCIFGIFALACFFLHIPKEKGIECYKKARTSIGISCSVLTIYCIMRLFFPQYHGLYEDFWWLVVITLLHSWMTYATLLFLMETPRYRTRHFFADGLIPIILLTIAGIVGMFFKSAQQNMQIIFGIIFGLKCCRMFYVCLKEYKTCQAELDNYYDAGPDIKWIRNIIYISLFMSAMTIVAFYVEAIHLAYYIAIPIIYGYIIARIINFLPRKIDQIRGGKRNQEEDKSAVKSAEKARTLGDKVGPLVEKWVNEGGYRQAELTIKDVAAGMGTNQNYLSQYLNNHLDMTFQVWLNTLRIEEGKRILASGEKMSIEEVGIRVGIPQSYNFSRWFKAVTNMTPYQYRKLHN